MEKKETNKNLFGEVVYSYPSEKAVEDGILMKNPRQNKFSECDLITTNLFEKLEKVAMERNKIRVFEITAEELVGCLMLYAEDVFTNNKFKGDNDKDFFILPATNEGIVVWFVRNENGKLTALLPEDY